MIRAKHSSRGTRSPYLIPIVCLALALAVAIGAAVYFGIQNGTLADKLTALEQKLTDAEKQLTDAEKQVADLQGQITDLQNQLNGQGGSSGDEDSSGSSGNGDNTGSGDNTGNSGNSGGSDTPVWNPQDGITSDAPAYQKLYPDFYAAQPFNATTVRENVIHLTFDDGPSDRTDEILDILKQENIKATFFVLHNGTSKAPERMRRIVAEGHTLAFHTYSHNYKTVYASVEAYLEDAYKIYTEIKDATGVAPQLFRCPGGSRNGYNKATADAILAEMKRRGFVCHDWNLSNEDSGENSKASASELVDFVMKYVGSKTRGIVLMHDAKARVETVKALPELIQRFRDKGFTFDKLTPEDQPYLFSKK